MLQNKTTNLIMGINLLILLLWYNNNSNADEISLINDYQQIYGSLPHNNETKISINDGKDKISYLCTIELSEDLGEFNNVVKPEFDISGLWGIVDKGKILSFRFTWRKTITFSINNTNNNDITYILSCLKPSQTEEDHDKFRYEILKDTVFGKYGVHEQMADIIASFAGFHHHNTTYHHHCDRRENSTYGFSRFTKYILDCLL